MRRTIAAGILAAMLVAAGPGLAQPDQQADAAVRLYLEVIEGRAKYHDLTVQQRWQVDEVARLVRERQLVIDLRSNEQRCRDNESRQAQGEPSALASRIIDMKCREAY